MAIIVKTTSLVAMVFPGDLDEAINVILASGVVAGQAIFQTSSGDYVLTDATHEATAKFAGVALESNVASGVVSMLRRGTLGGYTLSAQSYDDALYLSDTAGAFADAAGSNSVKVGRVVGVTDPARTKAIFVDAGWSE